MPAPAQAHLCRDGLVDVATSNGPEPSACLGCLACTPAPTVTR